MHAPAPMTTPRLFTFEPAPMNTAPANDGPAKAQLRKWVKGPTEPTTPDPAIGARLRKLADTLQRRNEHLLRPGRVENTPKRQCEGMGARCEAANNSRTIRALLALAAGWEAGTVPMMLRAYRASAAVHRAVSKEIQHPSYYVICEGDKYLENDPISRELRAWAEQQASPDDMANDAALQAASKIKAMEEAVRFQDIPGLFPTPPELVARVIELAELFPGCSVLEPSAGKGDLADAARRLGAAVQCVEINHTLCGVLAAKNLQVTHANFVDHAGPLWMGKGTYDRVLMNPPFENGQDIAHVLEAFEYLRPGGRLVAIVSESPFFRQDKKAVEFREWLEEHGARVIQNDSGAFRAKDSFRQTGVSTRTIVVDK